MSSVAASPPASKRPPPQQEHPVGVGLLGCSDIARRKFVPALKRSATAKLTAVASREPIKAATFIPGERYTVLSPEAVIASPEVDLVYISLPNHLHEEWTIRALEQGKHVICEKPLGLSPSSVERMISVAEKRRLLLYENLMYLHHPQHAVVKDLIAAGCIGRIKILRAAFGFPMPTSGNFRLDPAQGGGACNDLARYPLGIALHLLQGEIKQFRGFSEKSGRLDVGLHGEAKTTAGEILSFSLAFGQVYESYYEVVGERGKILVDRAFTTPPDMANLVQLTTEKGRESLAVPPSDHFLSMIDYVAGMVRHGGDLCRLYERSRTVARLVALMQKGCSDGW